VSDLRRAARDAVIVGTPTVVLHRLLVRASLDRLAPEFRAPLNTLWPGAVGPVGAAPAAEPGVRVASAWLDLRAEPVVLSLPQPGVHADVAVSVLDLAAELHVLQPDPGGAPPAEALVRGPRPQPGSPPGPAMLDCATGLALLRVRLVPRAGADGAAVAAAVAGLRLATASQWAGRPAPRPALPPPVPDLATVDVRRPLDARFLRVLDVLAPVMPGWPADQVLRARLALLGIGDGGPEPLLADRAARVAIEAGLAEGQAAVQRSWSDPPGEGEDWRRWLLAEPAGEQLGSVPPAGEGQAS
jgi:hypothetical protein